MHQLYIALNFPVMLSKVFLHVTFPTYAAVLRKREAEFILFSARISQNLNGKNNFYITSAFLYDDGHAGSQAEDIPLCGSVHPERFQPASPIELTTSWTEAPKARRSLETFAQSFLHSAQPKTRGPEKDCMSSSSVVSNVFS